MVVLTSPAVFVFWLRRSVSPTAVPLLFCFYILVRPSLCFTLLNFPLCSLLCSSFSSLVLPCFFLFFSLSRLLSHLPYSALFSVLLSVSLLFSSLDFTFSVFFLLFFFPSRCPPSTVLLPPAFIGQRPCAGNGQLDNVCRGMTAVTYAP